jgi:hypothetical protein
MLLLRIAQWVPGVKREGVSYPTEEVSSAHREERFNDMSDSRQPLTPSQVEAYHQTLSNWGRFGERDQLGALNWITDEKRAAAAGLVRSGRAVSCARSLPTQASPDNPNPVAHHMIGTHSEGYGGDYFAIASHGFSTSHIDAL